jgi:hypothetical protein
MIAATAAPPHVEVPLQFVREIPALPVLDVFVADRTDFHSTIIRSAHSTSETKIAGLPNFAPQVIKSVSVTPRAREHAPQENTGMCLATTLSRISLSGGQPTGMIASAVALRIR